MQALIRARLPAAALLIAIAGGACSSGPEPAPLQLDGGILTVDNRTDQDWEQVEIWVNQYYRAAPKTIRARTRFTAPLRVFVSGWGQTFPYGNQQIWDIRLTATQADGTPVEHNFRFEKSRLEDALGGNP